MDLMGKSPVIVRLSSVALAAEGFTRPLVTCTYHIQHYRIPPRGKSSVNHASTSFTTADFRDRINARPRRRLIEGKAGVSFSRYRYKSGKKGKTRKNKGNSTKLVYDVTARWSRTIISSKPSSKLRGWKWFKDSRRNVEKKFGRQGEGRFCANRASEPARKFRPRIRRYADCFMYYFSLADFSSS